MFKTCSVSDKTTGIEFWYVLAYILLAIPTTHFQNMFLWPKVCNVPLPDYCLLWPYIWGLGLFTLMKVCYFHSLFIRVCTLLIQLNKAVWILLIFLRWLIYSNSFQLRSLSSNWNFLCLQWHFRFVYCELVYRHCPKIFRHFIFTVWRKSGAWRHGSIWW